MEDTIRKKKSTQRRKAKQKKRLMIVGATMLVVGLILGLSISSGKNKDLKKEVETLSQQLQEQPEDIEKLEQQEQEVPEVDNEPEKPMETELPWNLALVNPWNKMEEGYVPQLEEVEPGMMVDSRIAQDLRNMMDAAKADGMSAFICSAYRTVERQEELFNNKIGRVLDQGYNYYDAYVEASKVVAVPGTSEHSLGLAVDIVSVNNTNLDESQEQTAEFAWFKENCYKYGFILRYPNGATEITGIIYEPWHYRYVGVEIATEITELGITFEEYLENHYNK